MNGRDVDDGFASGLANTGLSVAVSGYGASQKGRESRVEGLEPE